MSRGLKILFALVAVIALFVMTAPASLVTSVIPEENSAVTLSGFQGKVLDGEASQVNFKGIPIQNVKWDLDFISSITGTPSATVAINDPEMQLSSDLEFSSERSWSVSELNGNLQAAKLLQLVPNLRRIGLGGDATFDNVSVALADIAFEAGEGTVQWNNASMSINNQPLNLETITAEFGLEGDDLVLDYLGSSALSPNGRIKLTPAGAYDMTLNITPTALPQNMQMITNFGKKSPDGTVIFELKGRLR